MKHIGSFDMVHSLDAAETNSNDFPRDAKRARESAFLDVSQVTVLALIALWFRELKDKANGITQTSAEAELLKESLMRLPICCGMVLRNREQCRQVAEKLNGPSPMKHVYHGAFAR